MSGKAYNSFVYDMSAKLPVKKTGAKVIVEFRTSGSYTGEYGFDWIRMGDSGRKGDTWYANIMGHKIVNDDVIVDNTKKVYDNYALHLFRTRRFSVSWKKQGKQPFIYIAPLMTLRKGASAKLTLKIEVKEPAVKIVYKPQTPGIFKLSKASIPTLSKGKHTLPDELIITCLKEFSTDQEIRVYAYDSNNMKHLAGKLIIKANDKKHQVNLNVAIISVKFKNEELFPDISSSVRVMKKIYGQAYVNISRKNITLNLERVLKSKAAKKYFTPKRWVRKKYIVDNSLHSFLNAELSKQYPNLGNSLKIYYINQKCFNDDLKKEEELYGKAKDMLSHEAIILQRGLKDGTATHESLHCLGIPHSFSERNVLFFEIAFKRNYTDNIMDYSDMHGIPTIATWEFQWYAIQRFIHALHTGKW